MIYSDKEISKKIKNKYYPNIQNHLNKYKKYITSGNGPYGLHSQEMKIFLNPKIIFKNMFLNLRLLMMKKNFMLVFRLL